MQHGWPRNLSAAVVRNLACIGTEGSDSGFAATGALVSVKVMRNKATQISLGYGFLEFSSHDAASTVLATFNGKAMPGTNNVFRCDPRGSRQPTAVLGQQRPCLTAPTRYHGSFPDMLGAVQIKLGCFWRRQAC